MNAMLLKRQWTIGGLLMLCLLACPPSQAGEQDTRLKSAQTCAEETSRLERLNCYDALFLEANVSVEDDELPALWQAIERQEAARPDENVGLIVHEAGDSVLVSVPALGTTPPRPIMVMACERLITRFQLHLPTPISGARVDLRLTGDGHTVQQQWRVRDAGRVISGGRGLPAIDTLRQLLDADEVTLQSDVTELDGLRFNVAGLRQEIAPLREACRW
ncbi:type VI secretion system-associated protein VasI [Vreelandella populi]|uniref:type VI secretion system-associated protein VasI n=1 Tax=Vreelandella populi TaxID=2498858 RepID=UPI000F8CA755|nr:type VI secretion system-associated protein VasI [Halomonas populi]RUR56579.1 type VI secretion system-associated protein TagO [Halomonas populi]